MPFWNEFAPYAEKNGIKICIEQHGRQLVYNNESFFLLREAVGPTVGVNFDPSHLMWMGGDAVSAIKRLGASASITSHGKDTYIEAVRIKAGNRFRFILASCDGRKPFLKSSIGSGEAAHGRSSVLIARRSSMAR